MSSVEGTIEIVCHLDGLSITDVSISSTRPVALCRSFIGQSVSNVLTQIPLIFSICGNAQLLAAIRALNNQHKEEYSYHVYQAQELLLNLEIIREYLFKLQTSWASLFNYKPSAQSLNQLNINIRLLRSMIEGNSTRWSMTEWPEFDHAVVQNIAHETKQNLSEHVFAEDVEDWLKLDDSNLQHWISNSQSLAAQILRKVCTNDYSSYCTITNPNCMSVTNQELASILSSAQADGFVRNPYWEDKYPEATTLSRCKNTALLESINKVGANLMTRYWAKFIDLGVCLLSLTELSSQLLNVDSKLTSDGTKIGRVESARGTLVHYVALDRDTIVDYRILAPTEWNFNPKGVITAGLKRLTANSKEQLLEIVNMYIHSIDPCVNYKVRFTNA